ncbi:MAG: long-chain fatty acid--CoA ligase [Candidatus Riflebacteria bacterium]|nr:long-chain fatty acid--CoA ligase [Candidatus Riflebacteria bacterium]
MISSTVSSTSAIPANLAELALTTCARYPGRPAFSRRVLDGWRTLTYGQWEERSTRLAAWLLARGVGRGDRIAILSYNNPEWVTVDLAALMVGAVVVPMYPSLTGPQHNYILHHAKIKVLFVVDRAHLEPIRQIEGALDGITVVGMLAPGDWPRPSREKLRESKLETLPTGWPEGLPQLGPIIAESQPSREAEEELCSRIKATRSTDLATICYTSGTCSVTPATPTSMLPAGKGVLLTHGNLVTNVLYVREVAELTREDALLSVLPLAHMFERTCGYYAAVSAGAAVSYAASPAQFVDDIGSVAPTVLLCVPMLFERIYQRAFAATDKPWFRKVTGLATAVVNVFVGDAARAGQFVEDRKAWLLGKLLRRKLGGRLRFAVSGGAALSADLARFFHEKAGILILEGYGLTETSPVLTCNRPGRWRFGSVGMPITDAQVRIAEDGEVLGRGPMVMQGYLDDPEETAKALDPEGFFHTGDLGRFDEDGFLRITGRKKAMFKLSIGKFVNPEPIENRMVHELVSQAMVCGSDRPFAAVLIFPNLPALQSLAASLGVTGDDAALCNDQRIREPYKKIVDDACGHLPDYERIKRFCLVPAALGIDSGELTPTLKVKRAVVGERFKERIDSMYDGS